MSEEDKKNIATIISSILISNTKRMTIRQLNIEFQETEGYRIPHEKFGCATLEQFLRTLNDKVLICGSGMHAEVQVIISSKAAHINDLISKQRNPKSKRPPRNAARKYFQETNRRTFTYFENNCTLPRSPPLNNEPQISPTIPCSRPLMLNTALVVSPDMSSKGAIPKPVPSITECNVEDIYFSDDEDLKNTKVPQLVQDRLWRLIVKHPNGILSSNLLELYKKQYNETLSYADYGYKSIAQMCVDLRSVFNIVQLDKSEIKLFDKRKPIPQDMLNIAKQLQMMKIKASMETPAENAIPHGELEEMMGEIYSEKIPPDVFPFGSRLEQQWIDPGISEQDYLDVNVGEVYDPSKFWLNLKPYAAKLNSLMDSMQMYYPLHKQDLLVPYFALKKDLYVACIYSNEYHRARIVDVSQKSDSSIKVYFVDYGTVGMVNIQGVCYLHNQFTELPEQAIRARLAGIYPGTENEQWSRAASSRFLSFVLQKDLVALLVKINEEQRILDVVLADTTEEEEDFFINDALVAMGYAIFTFQERKTSVEAEIVPIVRYIHLYPTHYELENGLVPSAVQMINMHQAGLVIEQIYPHYFKDAKTDQPISKKHMIVKEELTVDYDVERPYYEENNYDDFYWDEEVEASTPIEHFIPSPSSTMKGHWQDIIDESPKEVAESSTKIEQISSNSNSSSSVGDVLNENIRNTIKEYIKQEYSQILNSNSACTQTSDDAHTIINREPQIQNNTNIENKTKVYQTNNFTQINMSPKEIISKTTNNEISINKAPLRPPPGYNSVPHTNTATYDYNVNNISTSNPNNYVSPQSYINLPMPYNHNAYPMPVGYHCNYSPYEYNPYNAILRNIQYLMNCGARLTIDQQRYLQSFNCGGGNYSPHYNHYGVQTELPYCDMPPPAYPEACASTQNIQTPHGSNCEQKSPTKDNGIEPELKNKSVLNPIADTFTPDNASNSFSVDQSVQVDSENENGTVSSHIENEQSIEAEYSSPKHDDIASTDIDIADKITARISESLNTALTNNNTSEATTNESLGNQNDQSEKELVNTIPGAQNPDKSEETSNDEHAKEEDVQETNIVNDIQGVESVYEECDSNSVDDYSRGTKLIIPISIGKLNMHIVCLEKEHYFLLSELLKKIFPKSLTVLRIRKLFVASPCTISIVDIRLKKNPELKKELLMYDLIKEDELSVDAVPIKYFEELIKIIPMPESDDYIVTNLLEEITYFLSEHNLKNVC